jgi:hypothetical protein
MPIIPRLKLLYAHSDSAAKMKYPRELADMTWDGLRDIWDGDGMKHWKVAGIIFHHLISHPSGYFDDERTVALHFSTDGVQLFQNSKHEVWPFLVLNLNLRPEERYIL